MDKVVILDHIIMKNLMITVLNMGKNMHHISSIIRKIITDRKNTMAISISRVDKRPKMTSIMMKEAIIMEKRLLITNNSLATSGVQETHHNNHGERDQSPIIRRTIQVYTGKNQR